MSELVRDDSGTGRILRINVSQYESDCLKQLFGISVDSPGGCSPSP